MLDRVREAIFSTLQARLPDATVLDLFAGSGSLGLEALSRGARRVRFVERGAAALAQLRKNVDALAVRDRVEIVVADALAPSAWLPAADVVFLDPPYALLADDRDRLLERIARLVATPLAPDGVLVLHAPRHALAPAELARWDARARHYGTNAIWYLRRLDAAR